MDVVGVLGTLFPGAMARYLYRRQMFQSARAYEAAKPSGFRRAINNATSGDGSIDLAGDRLRQLSRHLEENHDLTVAVFDDLVNNSIGTGIQAAPMVLDLNGKLLEAMNDRLVELWLEWCETPETTRELGWAQLERIVARSTFRDGEVFAQLVEDRGGYRYPMSSVRLALELLEADLVPMEYKDDSRNTFHGIQCNEWGQPTLYYVHKQHPGDPLRGHTVTREDLKTIPADAMLHLKFSRRIRQRRGVPILHAVINRLRDIADYEESERIAAKVAADFTWYIKKSTETAIGAQPTESGQNRQLHMQAGMGFELQPGEEVGTIASDRPNTKLVEFREAMLRAVAGGTGTRFSSIARNYNGTYSAQRQELVEGAIAYRAHTAYFVSRLHRPVWTRFVRQALQSLALREFRGKYDERSVYRADFRAPALPWIDPAKEAKAYEILIGAGVESRQEIMRQRGRDPGKVWDEIREERESGLFVSQVEQASPPVADDPDNLEDAA